MRIAVPFVASLVLLAPTLAAAWSSPAHQAIAQAAQDRLDPAPRKALAKILQGTNVLSPGVLASVATWADDVRARAQHGTIPNQWTSADIAEGDQFNAHHPSNAQWHFVDLSTRSRRDSTVPSQSRQLLITRPPRRNPLSRGGDGRTDWRPNGIPMFRRTVQ